MALTSASDPYTILGVDRSADDKAIAAAHRRLARTFHPDVAGDGATVEMMRINAAFDRIRDRRRRTAWAVQEAEQRGDAAEARHGTAANHDRAGASHDESGTAPNHTRQQWAPARDGTGGAGRPPGRPSGSVLAFGRHIGWSIGEIARVDPGYLVWLEDHRDGRPYLEEIDRTLRQVGFRRPDEMKPAKGNRFRR